MFSGFDQFAGFGVPRSFSRSFRCYSASVLADRESLNYGGKIILPPSALDTLSKLNLEWPLLFELSSRKGKRTHGGVLEFIAEEGRAYLPNWMMQVLDIGNGEIIDLKNVTLPLGTFVKIQAQSTDFLDITDHRAVLERALRNFATLTTNDIIEISYNRKTYRLLVMEVKPEGRDGISIHETDLVVDFAAPLGYEEPKPQKFIPPSMAAEVDATIKKEESSVKTWTPFTGSGAKINGRALDRASPIKPSQGAPESSASAGPKPPAPLRLAPGKLFFGYPVKPVPPKDDKVKQEEKKPDVFFQGKGETLSRKQ